MEERMDALRSCLVERFGLFREEKLLIDKESETFNPREYLDIILRREVVNNKMCTLEFKIQQLTSQLRADLINPTALADDQAPLLPAEQDAPGGLPQDADPGGETPAGP